VRFLAQNGGSLRETLTLTDGVNTISTSFSTSAAARLTVHFEGAGSGRITSDTGIECTTDCSLIAASLVTLTASTSNGSDSWFSGWSDPYCASPAHQCVLSIDVPTTINATFSVQTHNLVFVSSARYPANLGGTAAYDAACNQLATAAGINDAAGDAFLAALSGPDSFWDRMPAQARGWVRMDGLSLADDRDQLRTAGAAQYPVLFDEHGVLEGGAVWTGTNEDGSVGANCNAWTSSAAADPALSA
jgi:hypothetical protein